ncbi:hypothetical protein [Parasitella parasitica]|uniref:DUF4042 domain-containing protein n=1 Tax=Parasitella parasitica TaxID=35722 RepID=A0A0B7N092_9FUNG|nr:hypothetical protein [Parasitella parasitica]
MAHSKSLDAFYSLLDQYKQVAFPNLVDQEKSAAATFDLLASVEHVKHIPDQIRITNLRPSQFDTTIKYMLDGIDTVEDDNDHRVDLLRALSALIFENANNSQRFAARLSKTLLALGNRACRPLEVRRMAINCIGNACAGASGTKLQPLFQDFYACLLGNVCTVDRTAQGTIMVASTSLDFADTAVRKVSSSTLRSLQFLLAQDKTLISNPLCDIVEIIYTFIFLHVNVQSYGAGQPANATPNRRNRLLSSAAAPMTATNRPFQMSWRTPLHNKPASLVTSSESELSDSGSLTEMSPRRQRDNAKIRINALLCLAAIANTTPKALYPHWHKFLPDTFSIFLDNNACKGELPPLLKSDNQPYSLFTILLYDPMVTVRTAVCNTLVSMLDGSKQYISLAQESERKKSSFTSLSENLGSIIRDLHQGLIYALRKEQSNPVLTLIMHVITTLVENCSYEKLSKSHLPELYHAVADHWKESSLHSPILKAVSSIFSIYQDNLRELIHGNVVDQIILPALSNPNEDQEAQAEVWPTCTTLTKYYYKDTMPLLWQKLVDTTSALPISAASLKFVESYATAIHESGDISSENVLWWQTIIESYLQKAATDQDTASVRVAACDCFASMSKDIFETFHYRHQRLAITLLFSLTSDADANVRAAACRALGVFVLFPSLREDPLFFSDMIKAALLQKDDKTILVRVRASWATANLCDALVLENDNNPDFDFREYMSTADWIQVLEMSTSGSLDNEKLRPNAVRAIGSLLRVTPKEYFENTRIMSLVKNAMQGLEKNIETGSLKVRWNACHATSNMLLNPHFPIGYSAKEGGIYPWTHTVYQSLIHSLLHCKNFKVRINACLALTTPKRQDQYGGKLVLIVKSILEAWDVCEKNTEYKEIKYKQQLEQQIKHSLRCIQDWLPVQFKDKVSQILLGACDP